MTKLKEMSAEGIRARFMDRCDVPEGLSLVSNEELNRVCETTIDTIIRLAEAMDGTMAEVQEDKFDMTAFILGAGFGAVLLLGVLAVVMMI